MENLEINKESVVSNSKILFVLLYAPKNEIKFKNSKGSQTKQL